MLPRTVLSQWIIQHRPLLGLKKHAIQQGRKKFSVLNSFKTYGGFTPSTSQISMQSFVVLRCLAAEKCCLKILKIQQRGDPRVIFRSVQKFNFFRNHLILLQISCTFHIWKPFDAAAHGSLTMNYSTQATFGLKKHAIEQGRKKFFRPEFFQNLWWI